MNHLRNTVIVLAATAALCSCITPKKVLYLQDMSEGSQIELENKFEAVISPYDELNIWVSCYDEELSRPFNIFGSGSTGMSNNNTNGSGYLVDVNGEIQYPILGTIHAAGKTRLELQREIGDLLKSGNYIADPYVYVRFRNFKIFFLGADGGKAITIPNERCTFLEALSLSGDLSAYTKRSKIAVLREENGKMVMHYLDPRSSKIFNDPYFLLQQNDFIITQSIKSKYYRDELSYWVTWLSFLTSIASIVTMIMVFTK